MVFNQDKIEPCKECGFRYTCNDCKLNEKEMNKTTICTYNAGI